ncbi:oxygenase MpaB family protein [Rhodococcus sovatensis]|uniref:Oxygenase MpaB family protein n=1 Tax=Rhodococcus sovatensis TaxID=1805840 RepID=A0ABZ2PEU0_9NOCA
MRSQSGDERPVPLGPDSLTWKYFGDWRGMLQGVWAGSMQNMHPGLGAGVEEHSIFFDERWQRLYRSLYPIGGVVFDGDRAEATALQVRGYHESIKGVDAKGRRYHALDPDTFYWAHATFFMGTILTADNFMGGVSEAQKRQLFTEHIQWYRLYGMSMKPVPETWEDFQLYWKRMCHEVLEDNKATRDVLDLSKLGPPPYAAWIPSPVWSVLRVPITRGFVWLTIGLYDEPVRELLGYTWSERDERVFRWVGKAVNLSFALVPRRYRLHPRGRAGWDRARGRLSADAALPQTPPRNLPPLEARDDPKHYSPKV